MKAIGIGVIVFEGIIFLSVIALLIYFIVRRVEEKGKETFEQRDN